MTTDAQSAARWLVEGGVVAFPTETVYGLGADARSDAAVARVFAIKRRPADNPLIVHVGESSAIASLIALSGQARALIAAFVPGPLTLVGRASTRISPLATAGLATLAVRVPDHPLAQAFLRACAVPVIGPSANRSGSPSPTTAPHVQMDLGGEIDGILDGGPCRIGLESTVVDVTSAAIVILRPGAVTAEQLRALGLDVVEHAEDDRIARSPGTRHRHYAPRARVMLVDGSPPSPPTNASTYIGLAPPLEPKRWLATTVCADLDAYAQRLFDHLRESDACGADVIVAQRPGLVGIGRAITDRLQRAAAAST